MTKVNEKGLELTQANAHNNSNNNRRIHTEALT